MPLILGAQSALAATGVVTNSCRFEAGDNTYMHRTQTAGNQKPGLFLIGSNVVI